MNKSYIGELKLTNLKRNLYFQSFVRNIEHLYQPTDVSC
jgi:hypothetical protein